MPNPDYLTYVSLVISTKGSSIDSFDLYKANESRSPAGSLWLVNSVGFLSFFLGVIERLVNK